MSKQPKMALCRNCNTPLEKNAKICPSCGAKNTKPFYQKWWFILLVILVILRAVTFIGGHKKEKFDWNEIELCDQLPEPKSNVGKVLINDDEKLYMDVEKTSKDDYKKYIKECQSMGYTVESEKNGDRYDAFDEEGYHLSLFYTEDTMDIELEAPIEMGELSWPKSEIAGLLPLPESTVGKVSSDSADGCSIDVGQTSLEEFNAYADKCAECGFTVDYERGDQFYYADDEKGNHLTLDYQGNQVMTVQIDKADEPKADKAKKDDSGAKSEEPKKAEEAPAEEAENTNAEAKTEEADSTTDNTESADGLRPEFKNAMDSYETFMNEYCDFMKKYEASDGTDVGLLADYADYMSKYADVVRDFEAWDNGEMNTAETAYYLDVQTRISKKLLEVAE